jgi:hypothetical protein
LIRDRLKGTDLEDAPSILVVSEEGANFS